MSTTMMLSDLRNAARQRADMVNSQFVSDTELNSYINQSYFELYDLLVQSYGNNYFVSSPYTLTTDGTTEFYPLPQDFYKLVGLSVQIVGGDRTFIPLKHASFNEMQQLSGVPSVNPAYPGMLRYSLTANSVWLAPIAQAGQVLRMFYVPRLVQLVNDSDTVDGISGWTEYIICDAAIKCLQKEESDVSVLGLEKQALIARIQDAANNRDAASPSTIVDVDCNVLPWYRSRGTGWF